MTRVQELAKTIREADNWLDILAEVKELCEIAGLGEEWAAADADTFESIINSAADILGVEIFRE